VQVTYGVTAIEEGTVWAMVETQVKNMVGKEVEASTEISK